MSEINTKKVVGDTFEDMSIAEMTMVQGSGDVQGESLVAASGALLSAAASYAFSITVVKTCKSKC